MGKVVTFAGVLSSGGGPWDVPFMRSSCVRAHIMMEKHERRNTTRLSDAEWRKPPTLPNVLEPPEVANTETDSANKSQRKRKLHTRILQSARKSRKSNGRRICLKDRVHVLEKDVPDDPGGIRVAIGTDRGHIKYTADTHLIRARLKVDRAKIHVGNVDGPAGTTERYGDADVGGARCARDKIA